MLMLNISTETKFATPPPRDGVGPDLNRIALLPQGDIMAMNNGDSNTEDIGMEGAHARMASRQWKSTVM